MEYIAHLIWSERMSIIGVIGAFIVGAGFAWWIELDPLRYGAILSISFLIGVLLRRVFPE